MGGSERFTGQATDERVVYIVHPNMAVTRERKRHGKSVESRYAGEYVYMLSEGQAVFVNYVPTQYYEEDAKLQPHRAIVATVCIPPGLLATLHRRINSKGSEEQVRDKKAVKSYVFADTPVADHIDDGYLKRKWNELAAKLVEMSNHPQPMNGLKT